MTTTHEHLTDADGTRRAKDRARPDADRRTPTGLAALQRSVGNRAVAGLVRRSGPAGSGLIQRMKLNEARDALGTDPKYKPALITWSRLKGGPGAAEALGPMKTVEEVKQMLDQFLETPESKTTETQLKRIEFEREYAGSKVVRDLLAEVEAKPGQDERLAQLLANFKRLGPSIFEYTMESKGPAPFLNGARNGDCNTVVRAFRLIAEDYLGIPVEYKTSMSIGHKERFLAPQATTIDGKTGNVDGGAFWLFDNHYWIEAGNKRYDVLFGRIGVDTSTWKRELGQAEDPSIFEGEGKIWTTGKVFPLSARYVSKDPKLV